MRWTVFLIALASTFSPAQEGKYSVKAGKSEPPKEVNEAIRKLLPGESLTFLDGGKPLAPLSAAYYKKLGLPDRFEHLIFEGGHEFYDDSAWAFVKKHW